MTFFPLQIWLCNSLSLFICCNFQMKKVQKLLIHDRNCLIINQFSVILAFVILQTLMLRGWDAIKQVVVCCSVTSEITTESVTHICAHTHTHALPLCVVIYYPFHTRQSILGSGSILWLFDKIHTLLMYGLTPNTMQSLITTDVCVNCTTQTHMYICSSP